MRQGKVLYKNNLAGIITETDDGEYLFAYDLLNVYLHIPEDTEEMALTINGKKRRLSKIDFIHLGKKFQLNEKQIENSFVRFVKAEDKLKNEIKRSFLSLEKQSKYLDLLENRLIIFK